MSRFAIDTRIGYPIYDSDDIAKLQTDLNIQMKFNNDKFECVKYGRNEDFKRLSQCTCQDNKLI